MLITKRRFLIAAPAVLLSKEANAQFAIFQTHKNAMPLFVDPALQVAAKPAGVPRLNRANPIANGLLWFAVDTGLGAYVLLVDCAPGHGIFAPLLYNSAGQPGGGFFNNASLPGVTATRYGSGFNWPGGSNDEVAYTMGGKACTSFIWDSDSIRNAQNLSAQGAGAGYTIGAAHCQLTGCQFGIIFGRVIPEFNPNYYLASSGTSGSDVTNRQIRGAWYDGGTGQSLVSTVNPTLGSLNVSFLSAINTSMGVSTVELTVNGKVEASATGQTVSDPSPGTEANEGQLNLGAFSHMTANHASNTFGGLPFWGGVWKRKLTLGERQSLYYSPWQLFS